MAVTVFLKFENYVYKIYEKFCGARKSSILSENGQISTILTRC